MTDERERLRLAADRMSPLSREPYTSLDLALVREVAYRAAEAPEPEWEYGVLDQDTGYLSSAGAPWMDLAFAQKVSANEYPHMVGVRRRKAGPWEPA